MTHPPKLSASSILKWVSLYLADNRKNSLLWPIGLFSMAESPRFYRTKRMVRNDDCGNLDKFSPETIKAAQAALLDYLYSTRNLQFSDAEHISKNSPYFLGKLLEKADGKANIGHSVARFLRFHPINEFEPFFESLGLKPCEYSPFLPHGLIFLSDDNLLLENYHVLCNYGIGRNMIGKIHKEAVDVFRYDNGMLAMKLRTYEELGLSKSFVSKVIVASPCLLIGDGNGYFTKTLELMERTGIKLSYIEEHLSEKSSYNWNRLFMLLNLFEKTGCTQEQLAGLINQHPGILLEGSGSQTLALIGFLFKFGCTMNQMHSMFLQFPKMEVSKFVSNLSQCFMFLNEIEMELREIGKIICSYPLLLGSCKLKKMSSLLTLLSVGKKRLCEVIQQNPEEIKKWVIGSRVEPLPNSGEELASKVSKTKFLLDLGFVQNLEEIEKKLKLFRGRGEEFQERFDCIVKAGLDKKEVCEMIKARPQILQQKKHVIEMKINFLLNDLGYPISSLVKFPTYLCCNIDTVKLRFAIYNWLIDQGKAAPMPSLSTILTCSDKIFVSRYVNSHPRGPGIWQDLKNKLNSQ